MDLHQKHLDLLHSIDKRLAVLEERTAGLPRFKEKMTATAAAVAILVSVIIGKFFH